MFNRKRAFIEPTLEWRRHCILCSGERKSVDFNGLILFADGAFSARERGFRRGEAIPDVTLGRLTLRRAEGSDLLRVTSFQDQIVWLEFELDIYTRWHEVTPLGTPGPMDEPSPLRQRSELSVSLQQQFICFVFGLCGQNPPNF